MPGIRVVVNKPAVRALLKSPGVKADLERRAHNIAEAAGPGMEVGTFDGPNRSRASVITATAEAALAEATSGALTGAIDAGRA